VFLVDLPPERTLGWALGLNDQGFIVLPLIHRWPAEPCLLPAAAITAQLIEIAGRLRKPEDPRGVVLLLDGRRAGMGRRGRPLSRFDNRYHYGPHLFPPPELLTRHGFTRLVLLPVDKAPAADINPYLARLEAGGILTDGVPSLRREGQGESAHL
jgi:hypothetical protein